MSEWLDRSPMTTTDESFKGLKSTSVVPRTLTVPEPTSPEFSVVETNIYVAVVRFYTMENN